jgi:hypothetical protein
MCGYVNRVFGLGIGKVRGVPGIIGTKGWVGGGAFILAFLLLGTHSRGTVLRWCFGTTGVHRTIPAYRADVDSIPVTGGNKDGFCARCLLCFLDFTVLTIYLSYLSHNLEINSLLLLPIRAFPLSSSSLPLVLALILILLLPLLLPLLLLPSPLISASPSSFDWLEVLTECAPVWSPSVHWFGWWGVARWARK